MQDRTSPSSKKSSCNARPELTELRDGEEWKDERVLAFDGCLGSERCCCFRHLKRSRVQGDRTTARRLVAVRRPAVLVLAKGERPQPWLADRRGSRLHDPANDDAIAEHVEVVLIPSPDGREADARLRIPKRSYGRTSRLTQTSFFSWDVLPTGQLAMASELSIFVPLRQALLYCFRFYE